MDNKLFVVDLDGTLLDTNDGLSDFALETLNNLIDQGLNLLIATGRDMENAIKALRTLKITNDTVLTNGAILANLNSREYSIVRIIDKEISEDILKIADELGLAPIVYAAYDEPNHIVTFKKGKWDPKGMEPLSIKDYSHLFEQETISIQFCDNYAKTHKMYEVLDKKYRNKINLIEIQDVILGDYYWLEINSPLAGKEKMIETFLEMHGITWENVIAFGDQTNDLEFLKKARFAVCPENADPKLFEYVDKIVPHAASGGIIKEIRDIFLKKRE